MNIKAILAGLWNIARPVLILAAISLLENYANKLRELQSNNLLKP